MNVVRVVSELAFPPHNPGEDDPGNTELKGAITSYVIATVYLIIVAFMQFRVSKNEFANYYLDKAEAENNNSSNVEVDGLLDKTGSNTHISELTENH